MTNQEHAPFPLQLSEQEKKDLLAEANDQLVNGKRCMAISDYQSAVDFLEEACRQFDSVYGVGKRECADAYLEYGLALVSLANAEADLLNGLEGENDANNDVDDDDDNEEKENDVADEQKPQNVSQEAQNNRQQLQTESTNNGHQETAQNKVKSSFAGASSSNPMPGTSSGEGTTGVDDDTQEDEEKEATTMEIAWEVLCLAKRVYMTDESLDAQLKLAETLQKLGEISIEWDNNDNAVSILQECLNIRKAILKEDDRLISVTYYNLGLAHSFKQNTAEANLCFTNSMKVIEKRIEYLQTQLKLAEQSQDVVARTEHEKELQELKELLPEISMRVDEEDNKTNEQAIKRSREESAEEEAQLKRVCSDKSKPVADISHLVKRK